MGRTIAFGDIHGELRHLKSLIGGIPAPGPEDTLVFLGDYLDRGPQSAQVIDFLRRELPALTPARIVMLRGNHEDGWLKVLHAGEFTFAIPQSNGCLATLRSFTGGPVPAENEVPTREEYAVLLKGTFFPADVVRWLDELPRFYEDEHAIYVHAGLPRVDDRWCHPAELDQDRPLLWQRSDEFFKTYRGKRVVFGHTPVDALPQEMSSYTPQDLTDLFARGDVVGIDTGCGHGGFLTAVEFPALIVYESRRYLTA